MCFFPQSLLHEVLMASTSLAQSCRCLLAALSSVQCSGMACTEGEAIFDNFRRLLTPPMPRLPVFEGQ